MESIALVFRSSFLKIMMPNKVIKIPYTIPMIVIKIKEKSITMVLKVWIIKDGRVTLNMIRERHSPSCFLNQFILLQLYPNRIIIIDSKNCSFALFINLLHINCIFFPYCCYIYHIITLLSLIVMNKYIFLESMNDHEKTRILLL